MNTQLKPCPFCGGKAELSSYGFRGYSANCANYDCIGWTVKRLNPSKNDAIREWNRRTT